MALYNLYQYFSLTALYRNNLHNTKKTFNRDKKREISGKTAEQGFTQDIHTDRCDRSKNDNMEKQNYRNSFNIQPLLFAYLLPAIYGENVCAGHSYEKQSKTK